jgi:hypothetical protein
MSKPSWHALEGTAPAVLPWLLSLELSTRARHWLGLLALCFFFELVVLDSALHLFHGFEFLRHPVWWVSVCFGSALNFVCWYWVSAKPNRSWLAVGCGFLLGLFATGVASAGCSDCRFHWLTAATLSNLFFSSGPECSWLDLWLGGAGWAGIFMALASGNLIRTLRKSVGRHDLCATGRLMSALGVSGLYLSPLSAFDRVACQSFRVDLTSPQFRFWLWSLWIVGAIGLTLLGIAMRSRRARWLTEVAAGAVAGFSTRPATAQHSSLPIFHDALFAEPNFVLFERRGNDEQALGRVPEPATAPLSGSKVNP